MKPRMLVPVALTPGRRRLANPQFRIGAIDRPRIQHHERSEREHHAKTARPLRQRQRRTIQLQITPDWFSWVPWISAPARR
jgi:hypothetical protein